MDSEIAVNTLMEVDPQFVQLVDTLFGDIVDPAEAWAYLYATEPVVKMGPESSEMHVPAAMNRGGKRGRLVKRTRAMDVRGLAKADDTQSVEWSVEFSKVDTDKREVFGWASIVKMDGKPVIDRQGDWIEPDDIEKAAYQYVIKSRKGGHQHRRTEDGQPFHASDLIESMVFTDEKITKMGLPDDFPRGWWTGFKVHDDDTWARIKKGDVTGFSIHGSGKRVRIGEA